MSKGGKIVILFCYVLDFMLKENEDNIVWREGISDIDKWLVIARAMMSFTDAILLDFQNIMINELSNSYLPPAQAVDPPWNVYLVFF